MSVSLVRLKDDEKSSKVSEVKTITTEFKNSVNPWDFADLTTYRFYCCPECPYKVEQDFLFRDHMHVHHQSVPVKKVKLDVSKIMQRFLREDSTPKDEKYRKNEFNLPEAIDVIKNPPLLKMPSKDPFDTIESSTTTSNERISKTQCSITILQCRKPSITESESNDENFEPIDFQDEPMPMNETSLVFKDQEKSDEVMEDDKAKVPAVDKGSKKCQDCSIVFLTPFRLQRHIKKFHGGLTPTMASSEIPIGKIF